MSATVTLVDYLSCFTTPEGEERTGAYATLPTAIAAQQEMGRWIVGGSEFWQGCTLSGVRRETLVLGIGDEVEVQAYGRMRKGHVTALHRSKVSVRFQRRQDGTMDERKFGASEIRSASAVVTSVVDPDQANTVAGVVEVVEAPVEVVEAPAPVAAPAAPIVHSASVAGTVASCSGCSWVRNAVGSVAQAEKLARLHDGREALVDGRYVRSDLVSLPPEQEIVVVFDVSSWSREDAATLVHDFLRDHSPVGARVFADDATEPTATVESWWFPEADLKHIDRNDNAAMSLVRDDR